MTMAIANMDDLLRQLREHPEWRDALRRELASEDMLALPGIMRELAEAEKRTEQGLAALTARVDDLAAKLAQLTERVDALTERVDALVGEVRIVSSEVDDLRGDNLERRYREHAASYFAPLLRKIRALQDAELDELADQALEAGKLDLEERADLVDSDVVVSGRDLQTRAETYVVVEVSGKVDLHDVQRADRRAKILAKVVQKPVIATVGGESISPEAQELAERLGVAVLLDGRRLKAD